MADHRAELTPLGLVDEIDEALNAVPEVARSEARKAYRWLVMAAVAVAVIVSLAVSIVAINIATDAAAAQNAADAAQAERSANVDTALQRLEEANQELEARGQAPVQTSAAPDQSEAIAAAVLAQVLAQLPPAPSAEDVAARIQGSVTANVLGPTRQQLVAEVAAYFQANPPQPGPPPSQDAIRAAVDAALAANPPPRGERGEDGRDGQDGQSPPCLSEPNQCRGEDGQDGQDGKDGVDSTVPGPPVESWTWPDPGAPEVTHTCVRSGGDDTSPTYSCD